ncbi:MAG: hypothetical protein KGL39_21710 [Patescibacteria group bacterium]|nr:hypothetical protein [Patescibacteria group bacterium]
MIMITQKIHRASFNQQNSDDALEVKLYLSFYCALIASGQKPDAAREEAKRLADREMKETFV